MLTYLIRRLFLLPLTLFAILLVNFVILNLAPSDPVNHSEISSTGDATRTVGSLQHNHYLQFREHYGLTLPILFNTWPSIQQVKTPLQQLVDPNLKPSEFHALLIAWGDRARFVMPLLLDAALDQTLAVEMRKMAATLFIRGTYRQGYTHPKTAEEKQENRNIAATNTHLRTLMVNNNDPALETKVSALKNWFQENQSLYPYPLPLSKKIKTFFLETRFCAYMKRVLTLDFGTLRNDANKKVIDEVIKRLKISLTLSFIPLVVTFCLCQVFGMCMALFHNQWQDHSLNTSFLILFAIPIFVAAPFLIEHIGLKSAIPISGFQSHNYKDLTSQERLFDIIQHIFLPLIAVTYGTLAVQSRLFRTTVLEILHQDFVRMAKAKGLPFRTILFKHVGRNAAITLVTAFSTSLGVILGGSLIIETVFEINGFGRFFYDAIVNHDYNVMLFSVLASSFLTLIGYLMCDIAYTKLDPRVSLQ